MLRSAGLFTLLEPNVPAVLKVKLDRLPKRAEVVATGNRCLMRSAGSRRRDRGARASSRELLDDAYRAAGRYE